MLTTIGVFLSVPLIGTLAISLIVFVYARYFADLRKNKLRWLYLATTLLLVVLVTFPKSVDRLRWKLCYKPIFDKNKTILDENSNPWSKEFSDCMNNMNFKEGVSVLLSGK